MSPARTSSRTVVETVRSSSVPHSSWIAAAILRRDSSSSPGTGRRSSSARSSAKMRASLLSVVRRRASVGWAVMTSSTSASASASRSSVALVPPSASRAMASRSEPRRGAGASLELARAQAPDPIVVLGEVHERVPARQHPDEQLDLRKVEPGDEAGQLVRRGGVAAARAPAERDRASMQLERRRALARADDVLEETAQQGFVGDEAAAGCGVKGSGRDHAVLRYWREPPVLGSRAAIFTRLKQPSI